MKKKIVVLGLALATTFTMSGTTLFASSSYSNLKEVEFKYDLMQDKEESNVGISYYTDEYFYESSDVYNPSLATLSLNVAMSSSNAIDYDDYSLKSTNITEFFSCMGFNDIEVNDGYLNKPTRDSIGLCIGNKEIAGDTLIVLGVRSGGYGAEWASNFNVGLGTNINYHHEGFYNASTEALEFIDDYLTEQEITGDIKLWVSGYSRGGATTNLIAGRIDTALASGDDIFDADVNLSYDDLYAYTFEAPQGASYNSVGINPRGSNYDNIFNIINPNDIVPKVPFSEFGFTRYGNDLYINTLFTNPDTYSASYNKMISYYNSLDEEIIDYTVDSVSAKTLTGNDDETKTYTLQEINSNLINEIANQVGSRENYVEEYQDDICDAMALFFSLDSKEYKATFNNFCKGLLPSFLSTLGITEELDDEDVTNNEIIKRAGSTLIGLLYDVWETSRSSELYSLAHNISSVGQAHYVTVLYAWLMSCDPNYNKGTLNTLNETYTYYHVKLYAYNDLTLTNTTLNKKVITMDGHYFTDSDVTVYYDGYTAGFYSPILADEAELFIPSNYSYKLVYDGAVKATHKNASVAIYYFDGEVGCDTLVKKVTNKLTMFTSAKTLTF